MISYKADSSHFRNAKLGMLGFGARLWPPLSMGTGRNETQVPKGGMDILAKLSDPCPYCPAEAGAVARAAMAGACSLGLLQVLLLAVARASLPGIVIRLNMAALDYGKRPAKLPPSV